MKAKELERYKRLLETRREELARTGATVSSPTDATGDLIDRATADTETELQIRLRETDNRMRKAIEAALGRIDAGRFGICEACGQPITPARLDSVPWTRFCRECKDQRRPAA